MNKRSLFIHYPKKNKLDLLGKYKLLWTEEALDIEQSKNEELITAHTPSFLGTVMSNKKRFLFLTFLFLGLFIILGRVFFLQIVKGASYQEMAERNRTRLLPLIAERGVIYDKFNNELVENVPNFYLSIIPQALPTKLSQRKYSIKRIAQISEISSEDIKKQLSKYRASSYQSLVIKDNLDYHTALKIYTENSDLPGILIGYGSKRHYLYTTTSTSTSTERGSSFSHILGYLGKINEEEWEEKKFENYLPSDSIGKTGIEKKYEKELRGVYGDKEIEVDALEREQTVLSTENPVPGQNLILTIDKEAQEELEKILVSRIKKLNKQKGAAIAMDPKTGEILAMVSYPFFDNNDFSTRISSTIYKSYLEDKNLPLFNRAISGTYPAGSTLKLVIALAALEEKIIDTHTTFNSTGGIKISRWFFPDWKTGGHGLTNVTKAIAWSVNTFFYYIGGGYGDFKGMGADTLLGYFKIFNLGETTGVDLPGEAKGFIPSKEWKLQQRKEPWYVGDTYNISIGQGDTSVTPLQVALWTSAMVNEGKIIQPHLLHATMDPLTKKLSYVSTTIKKENFVNPVNLQIIKQGMRQCVLDGSCKILQQLTFPSGGKTGTAQWNNNFEPHAWFTAFAPYDNPKIVVTILIEEGKEGAEAAMPVAYEFLKWWGNKYLTQ